MNVRAWVLVLAGGEGRRLRGLTRDSRGRAVPKQYCAFGTGRSLLSRTLDRALLLAPHDRVLAVVTAAHREWWQPELETLPSENVVVQPENRGTAPGILLPLLHLAARDPRATVVVLPSDHHVTEEEVLVLSVADAIHALVRHPQRIILLGITPECPDPEYGWVMPEESGSMTHPVAAFVEKPAPADATRLMAQGAVWNSFMFAGRVQTLLETVADRLPELVSSMRGLVGRGGDSGRLAGFYRTLAPRDFSREVLQALPARLRVLAVPACGWTDLGTPERLARALAGRGATAAGALSRHVADPAGSQSAA